MPNFRRIAVEDGDDMMLTNANVVRQTYCARQARDANALASLIRTDHVVKQADDLSCAR